MMKLPPKWMFFFTILFFATQAQSPAGDYFLTIGGGYAPTGNQISLEKNVQLFQQLVQERFPNNPSHTVLFSDGKSPGRDLQYRDPKLVIPPVNRILAQIFGKEGDLAYQYRSHQVKDVAGGASRKNIQQWFEKTGAGLKPGDRVFIYVTAHGGESDNRRQPYNTTLYLWNGEKISVTEFSKLLDKIPDPVDIMTVMVQCHCGGFADLIFNQADPTKGTSKASRCGFFATVYDRPAAGCTPDINEKEYQEYSTYFWEAIRGVTRTGKPIGTCDYDQDGSVSFSEAHAYAVLTSTTIDISVSTSDSFLRAYGKSTTSNSGATSSLLTSDSPYTQLLSRATPVQKAILNGLSEQLKLTAQNRGKEAWELAQQVSSQKQQPNRDLRTKNRELASLRKELRSLLTKAWPELNNPFNPALPKLLAEQSKQILASAAKHPRYDRSVQLQKEVDQLQSQLLNLDRRWAKAQRLLRALETVALAANLPKVASKEIQQRYTQLLKAEAGTFGGVDATVAEKSQPSN
ncbi:MAG TPA: hypothetical protein EYN70_02140 [Planctomycetaceae bacterium]|nr:hypothetical protein [Planctomycetaceae bacterium]